MDGIKQTLVFPNKNVALKFLSAASKNPIHVSTKQDLGPNLDGSEFPVKYKNKKNYTSRN